MAVTETRRESPGAFVVSATGLSKKFLTEVENPCFGLAGLSHCVTLVLGLW